MMGFALTSRATPTLWTMSRAQKLDWIITSNSTTPTGPLDAHLTSRNRRHCSRWAHRRRTFAACYRVKDRAIIDEPQQYYKLPREDFDLCDPIKWWFGHHAQFPNLFCLACNIFTIPGVLLFSPTLLLLTITIFTGSAVAVERIFSGGPDTISLRQASLKLETIHTLMIVKRRLRLARMAVQELTGGM